MSSSASQVFAGRLLKLSYPIRSDTPAYPGTPPVSIRPHRLIQDGNKYNSYSVELFNHCGTHVDAPRHVYDAGPSLSDFTLPELVFDQPLVISVAAQDREMIMAERLRSAIDADQGWDFVAIRTGFGRFRESEPARYAGRNPGLSPEAAAWLVESLPNLRGVGLDTISLTPGGELEAGWEAHRILLDPRDKRRLVVEDMHLPEDLPSLKRVWITPLTVEGVDSSWCTVLAEASE